MIINTISYKEQDIDISIKGKLVTWSMEYKGQRYGNSVSIKKTTDKNELIGAIATIMSNAILTYEELISKQNEN